MKPTVLAAGLLPLLVLIWRAFNAALGANPLLEITHETGDWTLRFIVITLAITPVRRLTGWHALIRFRRMMGLYAFFYGSLHFLIYVIADRFAGLDFRDGIWAWSTARGLVASIWEDVYKRPYITVGFIGLAAMAPLAVTSTTGWIRRLGGRNWNRLHRLIYATAVAGVIHYWWLVKADILHPAIYASLVALLLGFRAFRT
ncbi:MAG: sulfoxide reductase heme-binding subunit YedZ [Vicinamibacterales bacterium]|nr:sulfoxide reductase heme-binding subunit YedZ [Vicinamibacterales bacterium]